MDARGNVTRYEYDPITSKPTKVIDRCENATSYTYDAVGRTQKVTAPNGGTVSYGYNAYDDLTKITRGDGQTYTMGYDAFRNLTTVAVGEQNLVTYDYKKGTNRLKSLTYANGSVQSLIYDHFGNVVHETWTNGNTVEAEYRYFYDGPNRLTRILDKTNKLVYTINRTGENITSIETYDISRVSKYNDETRVGTMYYSFDSKGKQFRKKYVAADGSEQKYVFEYQDEQNVAVQLPTGVVSHISATSNTKPPFEIQISQSNGKPT